MNRWPNRHGRTHCTFLSVELGVEDCLYGGHGSISCEHAGHLQAITSPAPIFKRCGTRRFTGHSVTSGRANMMRDLANWQ